ncbi:MAG: hypothetical protein AAGI01_18130 [Myxococcota bacterium]
MVLRNDYLMRMIERMADAAARVLAGDAGGRAEALAGVDDALSDALHTPRLTLHMIPHDDLLAQPPRMRVEVGRLMALRAILLAPTNLSNQAAERALSLLLSAPSERMMRPREEAAASATLFLLRDERFVSLLPRGARADALVAVARWAMSTQEWELVEDAVFDALDVVGIEDAEVLSREAAAYFRALAARPGHELDALGAECSELERVLEELESL